MTPVDSPSNMHKVQLAVSRANRLYIAGPMTGIAGYNFPAFNAAAAAMRGVGIHVENPAEHGIVEGATWADYLHYDLTRLATCEAIFLLPGWAGSKGARLEAYIAQRLGMKTLYAAGAERTMSTSEQQLRDVLEEARTGLAWYQDAYPDAASSTDDEAMARIDAALASAPAESEPGPVTQPWVHRIPMMQQSVLLASVRGPDGLAKYGGGAKMLLRWYRRCILLSAMDKRVLADPIEPNGGSFTGPSLDGPDGLDHWSDRMQVHVNDYLRQLDALPHHWQMHFMHAVEIVGYKHPDAQIRHFWHQTYLRLVHDMHVWPETEQQLDDRLGDSRSGWLQRADPATTE